MPSSPLSSKMLLMVLLTLALLWNQPVFLSPYRKKSTRDLLPLENLLMRPPFLQFVQDLRSRLNIYSSLQPLFTKGNFLLDISELRPIPMLKHRQAFFNFIHAISHSIDWRTMSLRLLHHLIAPIIIYPHHLEPPTLPPLRPSIDWSHIN